TITASGPVGPFTFAVTSGALPAGLALGGDGALAGTPTVAGTFGFTVTATGPALAAGSRAYTLTIDPAVVLAPAALPSGAAGTASSQGLPASGPPGPFTFPLTAGTLPAGLTLDGSGLLSGTPTSAGTSNFAVTATGATLAAGSQSYALTISQVPVVVAPAALPAGQVGVAYSQAITASGPPGPYTFKVTSGALPDGLTLGAGGVRGGTPVATGGCASPVPARNATAEAASQAYTLTVDPRVVISPDALPAGVVGTAYSQTLGASGPPGPFTFTVTAGSLPAGLTL